MKKIRFDDCICISKLVNHQEIKDDLLKEIQIGYGDNDNYNNFYTKDKVSKLDWSKSRDFNRPWARLFLPSFGVSLENIIKGMGYSGIKLVDLWYQQYLENDTHGWHIHGEHFTGVYYLQYPKSASRTEICSPFSMRHKKLKVKEGDIIVFPSHWIHRGPPNGKEKKTIISFNFNIEPTLINWSMIK